MFLAITQNPMSTPYRMVYRQQNRKPVSGQSFVKDIVMVDSDDEIVPRGPRRRCLYDCGLIINFVEFNTLWKEDVVMQTVESCLHAKNMFRQVLRFPMSLCICF